MTYVQFLILGLGAGAVYAALGTSIVLAYRSSGVINFAAGAVASYVAYVYAGLRAGNGYLVPIPGLPAFIGTGGPVRFFPALVIALLTAAALGLAMYWVVFRWLANALPLAKVVASLGVMLVLESLVGLRFGTQAIAVAGIFPAGSWHLWSLSLPKDRVLLAVAVVLVAVGVWAISRFTRFGLLTRAAADSERGAVLAGVSPHRIGSLNWILAAVITGAFGILMSPLTPLTPDGYTLFIVPGLAAALAGSVMRIGPAVLTGLVIGAAQSLITYLQTFHWFPKDGMGDVVPLVVIVLFLLVGRNPLRQRGLLFKQSLPASPRPRAVLPTALVGGLALVGAALLLTHQFRSGLMTSIGFAVVALSWVVIVGYVGQVSLAQLTLAGVSAFVLSRLTAAAHIPFPASVLLAALAAAAVGVLIGTPALRLRGVNLAIVTLGAALAIQSAWFNSSQFNGGTAGAPVGTPRLFGFDLGVGQGAAFPRVAFAVTATVFLVLVGLLVASLRRSRLGGQMLAIRFNDRAAEASGINVPRVKVVAFGISSFIAGIGGGLLAYQSGSVSEPAFDLFVALSVFALCYLSGITSITGAMLAGFFAPGGLFYVFLTKWGVDASGYYTLVSGGLLTYATIHSPQGFAGRLFELGHAVRRRIVGVRPGALVAPVTAEASAAVVEHRTGMGVEQAQPSQTASGVG